MIPQSRIDYTLEVDPAAPGRPQCYRVEDCFGQTITEKTIDLSKRGDFSCRPASNEGKDLRQYIESEYGLVRIRRVHSAGF
jgi:hypothetical protein